MVVTFVTHDDPRETAKLLDRARLGKQRLEAKQIIDILSNVPMKNSTKVSSRKHPAIDMWQGHIVALKFYFNCITKRWIKRGYKNTMELYDIKETKELLTEIETKTPKLFPWWFFCPLLQLSHQCSLYRKNNEYYSKYFKVTNTRKSQSKKKSKIRLSSADVEKLGYLWPSKVKDKYIDRLQKGELLRKLCAPLGSGAPVQYRIDKKLAKKWSRDKTKNPETGRPIKVNGPKYNEYSAAYKYHFNDS